MAAGEQPLGEPQQPDLGTARMGDGAYREDPHPAILAGSGPVRDFDGGECAA